MPAVYTRTFQIRQYECDAYGHVNNANYIRFMQEASLEASADVGYDLHTIRGMNRLWLIRETQIEYLDNLNYGDSVDVKTWVEDFRRTRSLRKYEFTRHGTDELVARAEADWVYLDAQTMQPVAVPDEVIRAYIPEGIDGYGEPREKFPEPPPEPSGVFRLQKRVEWRDIDFAGHVNNAVYFSYLDDCSNQVGVAFGWDRQRIEANNFALIVRKQRLEYLQPAYLDDVIEVSTFASNVKRASAIRHYTIKRVSDETLLARARVMWVTINIETLRPCRVPDEFLVDFETNLVP